MRLRHGKTLKRVQLTADTYLRWSSSASSRDEMLRPRVAEFLESEAHLDSAVSALLIFKKGVPKRR